MDPLVYQESEDRKAPKVTKVAPGQKVTEVGRVILVLKALSAILDLKEILA